MHLARGSPDLRRRVVARVHPLLPPPDLLRRVRWFFLVFALFFLATFWPQVSVQSHRPAALRVTGTVMLVALLLWWWRCYRRESFPLPGVALESAAFVAVLVAADDPFVAFGLLFIGVNFRALYGSALHVLLFTAAAVASFSGGLVLAAALGAPDRVDMLPTTLPGVPALAAIGHLLQTACERASRAVARERLLSRTAVRLVEAGSREAVGAEALAAVRLLLAGDPGVHARLELADGTRPAGAGGDAGPGDGSAHGDDPAHRDDPGHVRTHVPLRSGTGDAGALVVRTSRPVPREVDDALATLGASVALALQSVALTEDLRRRALEDPLTGLANRAALESALVAALADPARPVGVLLLDLDGFKQVNDTRGHAAGDAVLLAVARRLRAVAGPGDLVARLGGDEFVLVVQGAQGVARAACEVHGVLRRPVGLPGGAGALAVVGASVGTAVRTRQDDVTSLLRRADAAMYAAKGARPPEQRRRTATTGVRG